jgi:uncharacterized membrane protein YphA (DoxX/SURF4 family)
MLRIVTALLFMTHGTAKILGFPSIRATSISRFGPSPASRE